MSVVMPRIATVCLAIGGIALASIQLLAEGKPMSDRDLPGWIEKRIHDWQIKPEERPFDAIGWAKDIREAERLAREHHRPVFLFTHDGRMGIGRC